MEIPQYLDPIKGGSKTVGTLEKVGTNWIIRGEPFLIEMACRLFNGTETDITGEVSFPASERLIGEINWLMMRYPLEIISKEEWRQDMLKATNFIVNRTLINRLHFKNIPLPKFKGELKEFQKYGVAYLSINKKCILGDEMGLGKTIMSLAFLSNKNTPALVVVPPHLILQWQAESEKFLGIKPTILKGRTPHELLPNSIYLTHYMLLTYWEEQILKLPIKTIIFDEVQELRRTESIKYNSASKIAYGKENVIGLSGTPFYNYGIEIFNIMNIIEKMSLGTTKFFYKEWCDHFTGRIKKPEYFGSYLKDQGLLLRRRKEDVLSELPPKRRVFQGIGMDEDLHLTLIGKSIALAYDIPLMKDARERAAATFEALNSVRVAAGVAKATHVSQFTELLLEAEMPTILFGYHHAVIDLYQKNLWKFNPQVVTGRQTAEEKAEAVNNFMEGNSNLIILNLRTTAGLNLQRARAVVFGELDWSPAVHTQAEDRAHRIGTKDSVLSYYLYNIDTFDREVVKVLQQKKGEFDKIMGDRLLTSKELEENNEGATSMLASALEFLRDKKGLKVGVKVYDEDAVKMAKLFGADKPLF